MHVLSKTMQWVALTLAGFVMVFFSYMLIAPLFTQTAHAPTPIATYQIWLEGAVYFLSLAVFILALLTRRGHYLLFSALILLQGFLGARLGHWDAFQTNFFRQPFLFEYQQQWLIGCYVFILTQALFQSRILSFAYARALQFFLFFSAWLWLLAALSFPSTYFWLFFQYALPIYLMTLGTSLVAQEWLQDQHLAPTAYAYAIPTLIASVVCGVFTYLALSLHILPTLTYSFGAFIFVFLLNISQLLIVIEGLLSKKQTVIEQHNELKHYQQLSPFALIHVDEQGHILYHNDLFQQWIERYQLPTPIHQWQQYFPPIQWAELFENTAKNHPTYVRLTSLSIELPSGVEPSFCVFGFAAENHIVVYLLPATAHQALTTANRLNETLAHSTYNLNGLKAVYTRLFQKKNQSAASLPSFFAHLHIHQQQPTHTNTHNQNLPVTQAIHQHLSQHTRTPYYVGKISDNEFGLILTRFSAQQLNTWLQGFLYYLQNEVMARLAPSQTIRCHAGLIEIGASIKFDEILSVARSASEQAAQQNQSVVIYKKNAPELALHHAKQHFFEQLRQGTTRGLFLLMQPIVNLQQPNDQYHVEVLLRFRDDANRLLPTQSLINDAEKNGTICLIDQWVFTTALNWFAQHHKELTHIRCINLNLSGVSLNHPELIESLFTLLKENKNILPRICIEITESIALQDLAHTRNLMKKLKAMGVKIALDDFGAGYTSFSYLRELPANALKIDGSLIKDMLHTPGNTAIVRTIVELAQNLGMDSIAEWVEDVDTLIELKAMGVNYVQGFAISKAINPAMILDNSDIFQLIHDPSTIQYLK